MSAADFYTGIVPDVYSALRSTSFEAARYLKFVRQAGQPALELGCGDDGSFLELVRQGIDVEGVDSSQDMLDRCHARARAEDLSIVTHCQPMQDLRLPRTYSAIYLAGPTFNLLPDDDTAGWALERIADHLQPTGRAMIPGTGVERVQKEWVIHWHTPDGFEALAQSAGLEVTDIETNDEAESTAYLRRPDRASRHQANMLDIRGRSRVRAVATGNRLSLRGSSEPSD